jgi:hypothetical protein
MMKKIDYLHISLIVLALILGLYLSLGYFDSYEIVYVHNFQQWVIMNNLTLLFEV